MILYEEKILLGEIAQGNETAFHILFDRYRDKVFYFAWKLLQSQTRAEDVLQEVFMEIWINREKLSQVRHFKAYLHTLTRNHIYNALRKQANEACFLQEIYSRDTAFLSPSTAIDNLSLRELEGALQKAIAELTGQQKRVFELSRIEGLRHEEIARQLKISSNTVKKHMTEALRIIRSRVKLHSKLVQLSILLFLVQY
jgi:RNA polymerase sigma-70 factor (ECF subfamily)